MISSKLYKAMKQIEFDTQEASYLPTNSTTRCADRLVLQKYIIESRECNCQVKKMVEEGLIWVLETRSERGRYLQIISGRPASSSWC